MSKLDKPVMLISRATYTSLIGATFLLLFGVFLIMARQSGSGLVFIFTSFLFAYIAFSQLRIKVEKDRLTAYRFLISEELKFKNIKSIRLVSESKNQFLICFHMTTDSNSNYDFLIDFKSFSNWEKYLNVFLKKLELNYSEIDLAVTEQTNH